jgi:transcriptional regulator with XRE-family HTH domain
MTVGEKIKQFRLNKGMKQSDLAEKSGVSRVAIGNYERNDRSPGMEQIEAIAKALEINPIDLMGWDENELSKKISDDLAFETYLSKIGFVITIDSEVLEWH